MATFPAFVCPERFPMVDRQVAKWVVHYVTTHPGQAESSILAAPSPSFVARRKTTLTMNGDSDCIRAGFEWCRRAANVLKDVSGFAWRARDVEMAAFQNERSDAPLLPPIPWGKQDDHLAGKGRYHALDGGKGYTMSYDRLGVRFKDVRPC